MWLSVLMSYFSWALGARGRVVVTGQDGFGCVRTVGGRRGRLRLSAVGGFVSGCASSRSEILPTQLDRGAQWPARSPFQSGAFSLQSITFEVYHHRTGGVSHDTRGCHMTPVSCDTWGCHVTRPT